MKGKPLAKIALLAILVLLLGLKSEPQPVVDLVRQGDAYQSRKEYSAAIEAYRQATVLRPRSALPLLRIGQVYLAQRRYELAGEAFGQAYERGAKEEAWMGLGSAYAGLGHEERAIRCWRQALALDPGDAAVRYRLGRIRNLEVLPPKLPPVPPSAPWVEIVYRLAPKIARRGEVTRHPGINILRVEPQEDGSIVVHGETDNAWAAVRALLHYGPNCQVLGGSEALWEMRRTVAEMARVYGMVGGEEQDSRN